MRQAYAVGSSTTRRLLRPRTAILAALLAATGWGTGAPPAFALPFVPEQTYTIRTVLAGPAGDTAKDTTAVLFVPTPVDVNDDLAPDVLVHLTIDAGRAHLRTLRLPSAPSPLPLKVEAILADPRSGSTLRVAFGFDARSSTAPEDIEESLSLITDAQRLGSFAVDVATIAPGASAAITAALFEEAADGTRTDPLSARMDLSPVPTALHAGLILGSDLGVTTSRLDLVTDKPTVVDVLARDVRGAQESRLELTLDRLPNTVGVAMTDAPTGQRSFDYSATDRIGVVQARLVELIGGQPADTATLRFEDMPQRVTFTQDSESQGTLDAPGVIGAITVGTNTGGPLVTLEHPSYVAVHTAGTHRSLALRLAGVSRAEYDTGDPSTFALTATPGPFVAQIVDGQRRIDAVVNDLPGDVRLTFSPSTSTMTYEGSARIAHIDVDATDPGGIAGRATELHVDLIDVPSRLELVFDAEADTIALTACPGGGTSGCIGRALGSLEVTATDGEPVAVPAGVDGIVFEDGTTRYAFAARLTGLRVVRVSTGTDATEMTLDKAAGPFVIDVTQGARTIDIAINDLPASITATLDPAGALSYTASSGIAEVLGSITDPSGVSGRATSATVTLRDLPGSLTLDWSPGSGVVRADAGTATIGLIEFLLTSGPVESLPADRDGVVLRDLADRYVVFARLTGLKKIEAVLDPPDVTLETLGGRVLSIDLQEQAGSSVDFTRVTLDRLTPSVRLRMVETGGRRDITYTASSATNSLALDTNTGNRGNLHASMASPLPASVSFCAAQDLSCTPPADRGGRSRANAGSVRLAASEHTTVNLLDCVRPLSGCTRSNATEFTEVSNMRVRVMGFDADASSLGESGHIYLDTDDHGLTGRILNIDGSGGFEAVFPSGFRSQNRLGKWSLWGLSKSKSGSIACPVGTSLDVRVIGIWFGVTGYLC